MMAAAQPFISGAISKTINLPNEATVEDIQGCYELSWKLGLKANALYRDGSKWSQPLSTKTAVRKGDEQDEVEDKVEEAVGQNGRKSMEDLTPDEVLEAAKKIIAESQDTQFKRQLSSIVERKKLPNKRDGFTQKAKIGGQTLFVRTGEYSDGTLGEVFVDVHKEGASFRSLLNCFAIAVSIGLQYGVPVEEYVEKFTFTRFEPSGFVKGTIISKARPPLWTTSSAWSALSTWAALIWCRWLPRKATGKRRMVSTKRPNRMRKPMAVPPHPTVAPMVRPPMHSRRRAQPLIRAMARSRR
jgi:ribonucleoside-diphosphate reductase alpha chain